ncbi:hypothetical protein EMPS_07409 [Entomortierella parvispora]|uniref:Peptidase A1 domain-containing protein n=1 Tax=Entomortierella parvispora TaxID=205924 RepID=A0A9P3HE36_9FUNG|nr:hypothetical protein EMPS_07409 [Entomortierella parvispora]
MVYKSLLIFLLSVACVSANNTPRHSPFKANLIRPANPVQLKDVYSRDMTRFASYASGPFSIPAVNEDVSYTITVGLGTPVTNVSLIFDTGSSNLWVMNTSYNPFHSSTVKDLRETFSIQYGSGYANGNEYIDVATLGPYKFHQEFGVSNNFSGFSSAVQGLVGFGPADLSANVTATGSVVPTPPENLYFAHIIKSNVVGVWFQPITNGSTQETNGEITFGGVDPTKFLGRITYVPITTASPSNQFWGIDVAEVAFGTTKVSGIIHGIVDTGTTLILLSDRATNALYAQIPGAALDNVTSLYIIPPAEVPKLKNISFKVGNKVLKLTPAQYTIPQNQVANIGGTVGTTYSWIAPLGDNESGMAFILGQKFLENFYSVYDTTHKRVGLAKAGKKVCKKRGKKTPL